MDRTLLLTNSINSGSLQENRGLKSLESSYFSVEERDLIFWLKFVKMFSENVIFFEKNTARINGTWRNFIPGDEHISELVRQFNGKDESSSALSNVLSRPDLVLFLSFLELLQHPRNQFEQLTNRHKQFYYSTILGLKPKSPKPDSCLLTLELNNSTASLTLLEGTEFDGGKDSSGQSLIYKAIQNSAINQASISRLMSLSHFTSTENKRSSEFLLTHLVDTSAGIDLNPGGVNVFGENNFYDESVQTIPTIGFVIASPVLWLSEGERKIELIFDDNFSEALSSIGGNGDSGKLLSLFEISISTSDGLLILNPEEDAAETGSYLDQVGLGIYNDINGGQEKGIKITLSYLFPEIVGNIEESEDSMIMGVSTTPYVLFKMKEREGFYPYDDANNLLVGKLDIRVEVNGVRKLLLNNQTQNVDTSRPFHVFGASPRVRSRLYFSHPELLIKDVDQASLFFDWLDKPHDFSKKYESYLEYKEYIKENEGASVQQFDEVTSEKLIWPENKAKVISSHLTSQELEDQDLFSRAISLTHLFSWSKPLSSRPIYQYESLPLNDFNPQNWPQWFALELSNNDFGHSDYSQVVEYIAYKNIAQTESQLSGGEFVQVPEPYTPIVNALSLSYTAKSQMNFDDSDSEEDKIIVLHSMGWSDIRALRPNGPYPLLPWFPHSGYLYIGLEKMLTPGQVNIYFQMDPIDNSNTSSPTITWSYLEKNRWVKFLKGKRDLNGERGAILEDSTNDLVDSGLVTFDFPEIDLNSSTEMEQGILWIRASIMNDAGTGAARYSTLRGAYTQGVRVELDMDSLQDGQSIATHLASPLPAESITSLMIADARIDNVSQPFPSFGGKLQESDSQFFIRASELLRHKGRAQSAWDYEKLILDNFQELHFVNCLRGKLSSREINIVVVPKTFDPSILQPKVPLYLKRRIHDFIVPLAPDSVNINIVDPDYIQLVFDVRISINSGFDASSVASDISNLIVKVLTPWNYSRDDVSDTTEIRNAKGINIVALTAILEQHIAVDAVLKIDARLSGNLSLKNNYVSSQDSQAILVPSRYQEVKIFSAAEAVIEGIGVMEIELDFGVSSDTSS